MKPSRRRLLYGLYIFGITIFFLWYQFPSDAVTKYITHRVNQDISDAVVTIGQSKPMLPPGIKLSNIGVYHQNTAVLGIESLSLIPDLLSLFRANRVVKFKGNAYAGKLSGRADINAESPKHRIDIDATLSGLEIQRISVLQGLSAHKLSGTLDGKVLVQNSAAQPVLTGNLSLSGCRIQLAEPWFNQNFLTFRSVEADLVLQKGTLVIKKCDLSGNQLDASISGTITLNANSGEKMLNLVGRMKPQHVFLAKMENTLPTKFLSRGKVGSKGFSFRISGTLESPGFSLN